MSSKLVYLTVYYPIDHFVDCTYVWTKWHLWKVIEIQDCLIRKLILFHNFEIETKKVRENRKCIMIEHIQLLKDMLLMSFYDKFGSKIIWDRKWFQSLTKINIPFILTIQFLDIKRGNK